MANEITMTLPKCKEGNTQCLGCGAQWPSDAKDEHACVTVLRTRINELEAAKLREDRAIEALLIAGYLTRNNLDNARDLFRP